MTEDLNAEVCSISHWLKGLVTLGLYLLLAGLKQMARLKEQIALLKIFFDTLCHQL